MLCCRASTPQACDRSTPVRCRPQAQLGRPRSRGAPESGRHVAARCAPAAPGAPAAPEAGLPAQTDGRDRRDARAAKRPPQPGAGATEVVRSGPASTPGKLADVLCATWPEVFPTLSAARRVIRKDLVLLDGAVGSCKSEVAAGQALTQLAPLAKHKAPRAVSLDVLFEDDSVAVVHKPWGVKMYSGDARRTVTGALRAGALQPSSAADALPEPKPVHRLDAAVGGLLVVAKTASALGSLSAQFERRRVHKVYAALLAGRLEPGAAAAAALEAAKQAAAGQDGGAAAGQGSDEDEGESPEGSRGSDGSGDGAAPPAEQQQQQLLLDLGLPELLQLQLEGRPAFTSSAAGLGGPHLEPYDDSGSSDSSGSSSGGGSSGSGSSSSSGGSSDSSSSSSSGSSVAGAGPGVQLVDLQLDGRPCYTLWRVLGHSAAPRFGGWMTTVSLSPVTGRKHQLRRHMSALGCPIVGDGRYAQGGAKAEHISNQGVLLESVEVAFAHPATGRLMHVRAPEPARFATLRQQQATRAAKLARQAAADAGGEAAAAESAAES